MKEKTKDKKIITFEIPISMLNELEQLEELTFLSLSGVLRMIISDYLRKKNVAKLITDSEAINKGKE